MYLVGSIQKKFVGQSRSCFGFLIVSWAYQTQCDLYSARFWVQCSYSIVKLKLTELWAQAYQVMY